MEHLVVSLETARRLKAAKFPQDSVYVWGNLGELWDRETYAAMEKSREAFAAPTAQEIADQLPAFKTFDLSNRINKDGNHEFVATDWTSHVSGVATTMANALALLWLRLQETKS